MKLLTSDEILLINNTIYNISHQYKDIEYVIASDIRTDKLSVLVNSAQNKFIIDTATYYMKNLILLQIFPDGNHRTALESVRLFLHINNIEFKWDPTWLNTNVKYIN